MLPWPLQVMESVVKNCGQTVHDEVANKQTMEELKEILKVNRFLLLSFFFSCGKAAAAGRNACVLSCVPFGLGAEGKLEMGFRKEQTVMWCEGVDVGSEGGLLGRGNVVGAEVCLYCEMAGMCCRGLGHSMVKALGCNTWVGTAKETR